MIEWLKGICRAKSPDGSVIVDVNGVGYGIEVPLNTLAEIPPLGQTVELWIETHVREDALRLFGFSTSEEKQSFNILRSVSGVGPKVALAVISYFDPRELERVIVQGQSKALESVPGVGKRLAERLVVELKPKFQPGKTSKTTPIVAARNVIQKEFDEFAHQIENAAQQTLGEVALALENLGFKNTQIVAAIDEVRKENINTTDVSLVLKTALLKLRPKGMNIHDG